MQVSIPTSDLGNVSTPAPLNVRAFCTCDAFPGDFHEIVPGVCPDTYTESTDGRRVTLVAGDQPGTLRVGDPRQASGPGPDGTVTLVPIVTQQENAIDIDDAMGAALQACERRNLASGTITTWRKRWQQFAKVFRELPQDRETVLAYLDRFTTPKYRNSQRDALRALYRYAAEGRIATADPLAGTRGARVPERPVYTLTLAQVAAADAVPMPDRQRAIWELLVGHGWRQVEVQRILATDVRHAADALIWVRGKVRAEWTPVLPGTLKLLRRLAKGLADDDHVIRSRQSDAVGFDTVHRSATDVLTRGGLSLTIHGLRKTFASLVAEASGDEVLAMRLLRDRLPGQTGRYIKRNLPDLLERYSPLHQVRGSAPRVRGSEGRVPESTGGSARESNPPRTGKPARQRF